MEEQVLNIKDIFKILRKRIRIIAAVTLIAVAAAAGLTYFVISPSYVTTSKLFIGMPTIREDGSGNASWDFSYYKQLLEPYSEIIKSDNLLERAIKRGKLNMSQQALAGSLMVQSGESQVLSLSIYTGNPEQGVKILNAVIDEFIETSNKLIKNSNVTVISSPKISRTPVSPNKPKNMIFGTALGLALGIALALLMEYMDNSIKDEEEAENLIGVPVIGTVPEYDKKIKSKEARERRKKHDA